MFEAQADCLLTRTCVWGGGGQLVRECIMSMSVLTKIEARVCVCLTLKVQEEVSTIVVDVSGQHFDQVPHAVDTEDHTWVEGWGQQVLEEPSVTVHTNSEDLKPSSEQLLCAAQRSEVILVGAAEPLLRVNTDLTWTWT